MCEQYVCAVEVGLTCFDISHYESILLFVLTSFTKEKELNLIGAISVCCGSGNWQLDRLNSVSAVKMSEYALDFFSFHSSWIYFLCAKKTC